MGALEADPVKIGFLRGNVLSLRDVQAYPFELHARSVTLLKLNTSVWYKSKSESLKPHQTTADDKEAPRARTS
jgi:hypothetical protein